MGFLKELFWAGMAVFSTINALKAPDETVKAIYVLCMIVSLATAFVLNAIRTREK